MKQIALLGLLLITFCCNLNAQDKSLQEQIENMVEEQIVVGVAAGYSVDGKIIEQLVAGHADQSAQKEFTADTKVRMASIAKPMTALAIMQLVEQGRLDLEVPIQTYIPDYPRHPKTQITIKQLLSHTSGIAGYKNNKEANTVIEYATLHDAIEIFKNRDLLFEPGTQYSYTTYGYTVLGAIVETITKQSFETFIQEYIFDKAGMKNSGVKKFGVMMENESKLYHRKGGKRNAKPAVENNLSNRIPGGGLYTTLNDMFKFGDAVINNVFVKKETLDLMREHHSLEKERNAYGFGWFLYNPKPNEGAIIGHSGGQIGCSSFLYIVPEKKAVSVILANTSRTGGSVDYIAINLLKASIQKANEEK